MSSAGIEVTGIGITRIALRADPVDEQNRAKEAPNQEANAHTDLGGLKLT